MDETNETQEPSLDAATVIAITRHYCRAKAKHPYFADELLTLDGTVENISRCLAYCRKELKQEIEYECAAAETILECELYEMKHAVARGDNAHAVEECYDTIAVLLRMVDVLEGRQKLGRPECGR